MLQIVHGNEPTKGAPVEGTSNGPARRRSRQKGSLNGLKSLRQSIAEASGKVDQLRAEIIEKSGQVHSALKAQLDAVESLYALVPEFIAQADPGYVLSLVTNQIVAQSIPPIIDITSTNRLVIRTTRE